MLHVAKLAFLESTSVDGTQLANTAMYHDVDSLHGWGVADLVLGILEWKKKQAASFTAPQRWVRTIDCVISAKNLQVITSGDAASARWLSPVLSFSDVSSLLESIGYSADEDLRRALAFLDSIGLIVYKGRAGDSEGSYGGPGSGELDDVVVLRPQVVTDALQRLITPTVRSLMDANAAKREGMASWCEKCGGTPKTLFSRKLKLWQCDFCMRWYCQDHVTAHEAHGGAVSVCNMCTPLVATRTTLDSTPEINVTELTRTGRLSRALLASLWGVYSAPLQQALEALLLDAKFLCRAPPVTVSSGSFVTSRTQPVVPDGTTAASAEPDDLFVPCVFVQCPSIASNRGSDTTTASPGGTGRSWWIDISLWPAGMWSDVIGCLSRVNAQWKPERSNPRVGGSAAVVDGVDDATVELFPECGTIVSLKAGTSEPNIGGEEVQVHLECRKTSTSVVESRIVVSGWYVVDTDAKESNHRQGRQWHLMANVLQF